VGDRGSWNNQLNFVSDAIGFIRFDFLIPNIANFGKSYYEGESSN